ncbi:hypothetical protein CEQ90_17795 [Lewinellaceae bacterium SD302]|nr:hypothetical protein CEQ90_17795 [Lewinellaceae bacterium SD302]
MGNSIKNQNMKQAQPSQLFQLIQALTPAEKRHFSRIARRHKAGLPDYHCYFVSLENEKKWHPGIEEEVAAGKNYAAHLPVIRRQLFEKILYALDDLYRTTDPEEVAKACLHESFLLLKKRLLIAARRRLKKAEKLITTHGFYHLWPACHRAKMTLAEQFIRQRNLKEKVDDFSLTWPDNRTEMENQLAAQQHKLTVYAHRFNHLTRTAEADLIIPDPEAHPATRIDQLQAAALQTFSAGDPAGAATYNESLLGELKQLSPKAKTIPERILATTYNLLLDYLHLADYEKLERGLAEMRELPGRKTFRKLSGIRSRVFEWGFQLELNACVRRGRWSEGLKRLPELADGLKRYNSILSGPAFASLHLLGGLVAFHSGQPERALEFLHPLYQDVRPGAATDIYQYGRYLHLLCHYCLRNYETADSLLVSLRRGRYQSIDPAEQQLIDQIGHLLRHPEREKAIFREWKMTYSTESAVEHYLYLSYWLRIIRPG